jgi:hypothetical protein
MHRMAEGRTDHKGRMKAQKPTQRIDRPKQQTPADLIDDLMHIVRSSFYQDQSDKWLTDQHFIKRNVVLWPAGWLNKRGVTLPPDRYKSILIDVFMGIKQKGNTEAVKYWPGYLMHCVQSHFKIHGEEYYNEGKSLRAAAEAALMACKRATDPDRAADPVKGMALALEALKAGKTKKRVEKPKDQLSLF